MTIGDIARGEVVTAGPDVSLLEVAGLMASANVGSVVIVDGRRPIGIVTDRDLVLDVLGLDKDPAELSADAVMTEDLVVVDAADDVLDVLGRMRGAGVRRIPVMDGDRLVGIVTLDDFVALLAEELGSLADVIAAESPTTGSGP